ncbi:MAG: 4Fe-4S dicluster domain-containing protein [Solirubrobacterales bacterium]
MAASCLAVNGVTCSVCADPCEPRALRVRPLVGGRALPVIDAASCTGCGDCLTVCPVGALALVPVPPAAEEAACA